MCIRDRAYCDLSLPGYTSNIVNVGIQQGGIDTTIPKQISKTDMEKVSLFLTEEEKNTVMKSYQEDNTTYETDAYILKDAVLDDEKVMEKLSEQMNDAMLLTESMSCLLYTSSVIRFIVIASISILDTLIVPCNRRLWKRRRRGRRTASVLTHHSFI